MKKINRKIAVLLCLSAMWMMTSGFDELQEENAAGIESVTDGLTSEDLETIQVQNEWENKVLANVEDYVTVRSEANADASAVGRMYKGDGGTILESLEGWTKISSGNVEGYVSNEYLLFGEEAYNQAQEAAVLTATSLTAGLRIRQEASTDAKILKNVEQGAKLSVVEESDTTGEWIQVQYAEEKTGYVSAEFVSVEYELGEAMTMDEIEKKEQEEKREALKQQKEAIKASGNELYLLAALIQAEGGNQPYEGQVAIGAVVMNRVRSSAYPNNIVDVIYAPGQFGVVSNGTMAKYLSNPKSSCLQAAQEALNGYTNVGNYTHFRNASASISSDHIVIGNHVFY